MTTLQMILVGATIVILLAVVFMLIIWPKFFYKGIRISGDWEAYYNDLGQYSAILTIKQSGHRIKGSSVVLEDTKGSRVDRSYQYKGLISNRSIVLIFRNKENTQIGAMVFWISNSDATMMQGTTIYYKPEEKLVKNHNAILLKSGADKSQLIDNGDTDVKTALAKDIIIENFNSPQEAWKELIIDGQEKEVIKALRSQYAGNTEAVNSLVHIELELKSLVSADIRQTDSFEERIVRRNKLVSSLLTLIDELE